MRKMTLSASALILGLAAGSAVADSNTLFIEQVGSNNFVDGNQDGSNNETYVVQDGVYNSGFAATDFTSGSSNNRVLLKQDGGGNMGGNIGGWSSQSGASAFSNNTIGIVQETTRNFASLSNQQGSTTNSQIFIRQTGGNHNYVGNGAPTGTHYNVTGNNSTNGLTVAFSNPGVNSGLLEGSSVFAVPISNNPNGVVRGDGNAVGVVQDGSYNALALNVDGNNNKVGGNAMSGSVDLNNFGNNFFSNASEVDTTGPYELNGIASQDGNDNTGVIAILGNSNAVSFSQAGNNNVGEVYVNGTGNLALANQF